MKEPNVLSRINVLAQKSEDFKELYGKVKAWGKENGFTLTKSFCIVIGHFFENINRSVELPENTKTP